MILRQLKLVEKVDISFEDARIAVQCSAKENFQLGGLGPNLPGQNRDLCLLHATAACLIGTCEAGQGNFVSTCDGCRDMVLVEKLRL